MINMEHERLLSLTEASKRIPGRPHLSTLHRWLSRGIRGVRLESVALGGRRFTSVEAIERFVAGTTAAKANHDIPRATCSRRERDIRKAEQELRSTQG